MAEIFGTPYIETASDKLVALVTALKTTMASGYDPTFSYVYAKHNTAKIELNAVSVDFEGCEPDETARGSTGTLVLYPLEFSIRVHTAYTNGYIDGQKNKRLLNSIANKLNNNHDLGDEYRLDSIDSMESNMTFESTTGGEIRLTVNITVRHTQE